MPDKKYRSYASLSPAEKKKEDTTNMADESASNKTAAMSKSKPKKTDYAQDMKDAAKSGDKKKFYTAQRERAAKTGDTATTSKISSKLRTAATDSSEKAVNYGRPAMKMDTPLASVSRDKQPMKSDFGGGKNTSGAATARAKIGSKRSSETANKSGAAKARAKIAEKRDKKDMAKR